MRTIKDSTASTTRIVLPLTDLSGKQVGTARQLLMSDITNDLCLQLANWRNRMRTWFFNSELSTTTSTKEWLVAKFTPPPVQAFFVGHTLDGTRIAHVGMKNLEDEVVEVDALLRGEPGGGPDFIIGMERAVVGWAQRMFNPAFIVANTYDWNRLAGRIHAANGFKAEHTSNGRTEWVLRRRL